MNRHESATIAAIAARAAIDAAADIIANADTTDVEMIRVDGLLEDAERMLLPAIESLDMATDLGREDAWGEGPTAQAVVAVIRDTFDILAQIAR